MSLRNKDKSEFREGIAAGIPIGLGYFAVSFSLGIAAANAGLGPIGAFIASMFCNASAGEYAGFSLIAIGASYFEMALMTLIVNARYLLMSCAMSQKLSHDTKMRHRFLLGWYVTDELFAISVSRSGYLNPMYTYGAIMIAAPLWAIGTALGAAAGSLLPVSLVSAFSVALYGMFLAVIIPAAKNNKVVAGLIAVSFTLSCVAAYLPALSEISDGTKTIILTVVISAVAALIFPIKQTEVEENA